MLFLAKFLETRIVPERIEHRIEPEQPSPRRIASKTLDEMSVNFTFDLISGSGIADQLGTQFAHLYTLGVKCGWNYKHLKAIALNRSLLGVPRKRRAARSLPEILGFRLPVRCVTAVSVRMPLPSILVWAFQAWMRIPSHQGIAR